MRAHHRRDLFLFYDHESASKSEIPKMILSNDQKHTFTAFGARALFERKICARMRKEITSFSHATSCFSSFFVLVWNELLLELLSEIFRPMSFCLLFRATGLSWSLDATLFCFFKCFCSVCSNPIFSFHQNTTTNTHAYIILLLHHREGRERERERKVSNSSPLLRRIIAKNT